jgi:hypothetical protein
MTEVLLRIAIRLALCTACSWLVWRTMGLTAMVTTAPLYGVAMAKPLMELASAVRHAAKAHILRKVQGRYYVFRGIPVQVIEDDECRRWVRASDVRRVGATTATDGALALTYPDGWRSMGKPAQPHISGDALLKHLKKDSSPQVLRFTHWVEREIVFPAKARAARQKVSPEATQQPTPESALDSAPDTADQRGG